jgi:hypothetical protein
MQRVWSKPLSDSYIYSWQCPPQQGPHPIPCHRPCKEQVDTMHAWRRCVGSRARVKPILQDARMAKELADWPTPAKLLTHRALKPSRLPSNTNMHKGVYTRPMVEPLPCYNTLADCSSLTSVTAAAVVAVSHCGLAAEASRNATN